MIDSARLNLATPSGRSAPPSQPTGSLLRDEEGRGNGGGPSGGEAAGPGDHLHGRQQQLAQVEVRSYLDGYGLFRSTAAGGVGSGGSILAPSNRLSHRIFSSSSSPQLLQ
ncbi:hypothetical protein TYRP_022492 [Tyrophagus putrescentiae]|nr:hypothetical protein TYRP_022895 [Tyrophagus putrescentiae]KAH9391785.1 hypothetical protein TYRP_022492 [Tyrophagus putrescentiae]